MERFVRFAFVALSVSACSSSNDAATKAPPVVHTDVDSGVDAGAEPSSKDAATKPPSEGGSSCAPLHDLTAVLAAYGAAWNEADAPKRDCLLAQSMAPDAVYIDPISNTHDLPGLSDQIGKVRGLQPAALLAFTGAPEFRTSDLRDPWSFGSAQTGIDYMEIRADGLIASVLGFWDPFADTGPLPSVDAFVAAWNTTSSATRDLALATAVTDDVVFFDGTGRQAIGVASLSTAIGSAVSRGSLTGATLVKLQTYGTPPSHARFSIGLNGGAVTVTDYARIAPDGRLARVGQFPDSP